MSSEEIKEIYDIINEKQYSSYNKKMNQNFHSICLKKLKENISKKKSKIFDLFNLPKNEESFENKFNFYNINLKKINTILKDLSSIDKFPNLKKNQPYYDYKKNQKVKLKINKLVKKSKKNINMIPISLSQITFSPGRYDPNFNAIYKKPFYPFFGKSYNFDSNKKVNDIGKKIIVLKKSISNQSFNKLNTFSDSRNSRNFSLSKTKLFLKKKYNTISDSLNNNNKINQIKNNKLFSNIFCSESSFHFKNNRSFSNNNNTFYKSENNFYKIKYKKDIISNQKFSLMNNNKKIERK